MASRREFLHTGMYLSTLGVLGLPLGGCASGSTRAESAVAPKSVQAKAPPGVAKAPTRAPVAPAPGTAEAEPPPDIFDAQALDIDFWLKPRVLNVIRPASGERARLLYWKDGEVIDSAYQEL